MNEREIALENLCRQISIEILYAFGSRAREVKNWFNNIYLELVDSNSDVDIGVKPSRQKAFSIHEKVYYALALENMLGVNRVDLISLPDVDPFLAANLVQGERMFASDRYLADEYDLYILRRAGDLIPIERERIALILGEDI
jgi:predicted nucleotidyltransferase